MLNKGAEENLPEKFLVTSRVVSIAPCRDRGDGKEKRTEKETIKGKIDYKATAGKEKFCKKGTVKVFGERVIIF